MIDTSNPRFRRLFEALTLLALPAGRQIAHLEGAHVDELALDLHDAMLLIQRPEDETWLSATVVRGARSLDATLSKQSGQWNASFWTFDALRERTEWEGIRREARRLLRLVLTGRGDFRSASPEVGTASAVVRQALEALPERQRQVVMLRFAAGFSESEIATILDEPVHLIRQASSQARASLSRALANGSGDVVDTTTGSTEPLDETLRAALA